MPRRRQPESGDEITSAQGERLLLAREAKGRRLGREFFQREVVEKANEGRAGGLTLEAYGSYERGRIRIPEEWLVPIAEALDTTPWYILGLPEPKPLKNKVRFICDQANRIESEEILDSLVYLTVSQVKADQELKERTARLRSAGAPG